MSFEEIWKMIVPYANEIWKIMIMLQLFIISVILLLKKK